MEIGRTPLGAGDPRGAPAPEQGLLLAVLERALIDLRAFAGSQRASDRDALRALRAWFESDDCGAAMGGFSFVFVCDQLGLSPERIREMALGGAVTEAA